MVIRPGVITSDRQLRLGLPALLGLLPRHRDADSVLRRYQVISILGGVSDGDLNAFDATVECVAMRSIVLGNRSAGVLADIAAIVGREDHRQGHRNDSFTDLLAIGVQSHFAALSKPTAVVRELHAHLVISSGYRGRALDIEILHAAY